MPGSDVRRPQTIASRPPYLYPRRPCIRTSTAAAFSSSPRPSSVTRLSHRRAAPRHPRLGGGTCVLALPAARAPDAPLQGPQLPVRRHHRGGDTLSRVRAPLGAGCGVRRPGGAHHRVPQRPDGPFLPGTRAPALQLSPDRRAPWRGCRRTPPSPPSRYRVGSPKACRAILKSAASMGGSVALNVFGTLIGFFIMIFVLFFLLRDGRTIVENLVRLVPVEPTRRSAAAEVPGRGHARGGLRLDRDRAAAGRDRRRSALRS